MNWDAIGAIGEILGALTVVATLFYLSIQIRQNTVQVTQSAKATEIASYQDLIGRISSLNSERMLNPEWDDLIRRGVAGTKDLNESEQSRLFIYLVTLLRHGDMAYFLYERGVIDRERLISSLGPLNNILSSELMMESWGRMRNAPNFTQGYKEFIDSQLKEGG